MASRLLCSLILFLALGLASTYTIEDVNQLDRATKDDRVETATMEKITNEMFKMEEAGAGNLPKEQEVMEDGLSPGDAATIAKEAEKLVKGCSKPVPPRYQKKEKQGAMRKFYQSLQHGKREIMSDEKWLAAKKSEVCSACVLNKLCSKSEIFTILGISSGSQEEKKRKCKLLILKEAIDVQPKKAKKIKCDKDAKFRTIDGTCNNLATNPFFGAAFTPFRRIVAADYGDCISTLRLSASGKTLPNAREVSRVAHGSNVLRTNPDSRILTHLVMNFGQFMDHDITLAEAQGLNCEPPTKNPECINIEIPKDDDVFRDRDIDFIELERDAPHEPDSECKLVPREHVNTITAYVDASNVYGSEKELAESLRTHDGLLKDMKHPHGCPLKNLLPAQSPEVFCVSKDPLKPCFVTGDERNNENPGLNSVHTIFVRQHNLIATFFGKKTQWSGEEIYEVTRKIVGAQLQVITYGEFLPLLLSEDRRDHFKLNLLPGTEYFKGYNKKLNAQMSAGFAVAAYRMGHSLVQEVFRRFSQNGFEHKCDECDGRGKSEFLPIAIKDFGNPQPLYDKCQGGIDSIFRGLVKNAAGKADGRFSESVQHFLSRGEGDISDLVAINIRRGRERGIPGYTSYRNLKLCKLPKVDSFKDLVDVAGFNKEDVKNLQKLFKAVEDIDLFTGGMLEPADGKGGVLGPTFQCIIADQFNRLKFGDRFWHENEPNKLLHTDKTAFSPCQLRELRKTCFSKIICDNADNIPAIKRKALELGKITVDCNKLPKVNLETWLPHFKCPKGVVHDYDDAEW